VEQSVLIALDLSGWHGDYQNSAGGMWQKNDRSSRAKNILLKFPAHSHFSAHLLLLQSYFH